ncbi:MAG: FHA domain-containing protein [Myxococcales bacterium]|nr:FHA domain-containing protein [Myxococcales bacterium]
MSTTIREPAAPSGGVAIEADRLEWAVVIVHHDDPSALGVRRVVAVKHALELGRESGALGDGALDGPLVSRKHARIEVDAAGNLSLCDLGSANGTWVNGARVALASLEAGDIVRVGGVLLAVQRAPAYFALSRSVRAPVLSWPTARFVDALRREVDRGTFVCVSAPRPSALVPYVQRVIDDVAATGGARLRAHFGDGALQEDALSSGDVCVVTVRDGAQLAELVARKAAIAGRGAKCIAVLTERAMESEGGETSEGVLRFPSLAERPEELPWILRAFLQEFLGDVRVSFEHALALRLLRASWPEDVDGARAWAKSASARCADGAIGPSDDDLRHFGEGKGQAARVASSERAAPWTGSSAEFVLSREGAWFSARGETADLRTRYALARVLRALIVRHEREPGGVASIDELVLAGWPGEKLIGDSGVNRLYVAVGTLRKLGLRELIERREGGYRIAPSLRIELRDGEQPPARGDGR